MLMRSRAATESIEETSRASFRRRRVPSVAGASGRVLFRSGRRTHFIAVEEIVWLQSSGNYVEILAGGRTLLLRDSLATLLTNLPPLFLQISRGVAVRKGAVTELRTDREGRLHVVLNTGETLPVTRGSREATERAMIE